MKSALLLLAGLTSTLSFAPMSTPPSSISTKLAASSLDGKFGVGIEFGNNCPPLGAALLEDSGPKGLEWFQNAEIKHGRAAMLATLGFMVQKWGVHFPLYLGPYAGNSFHSSSADPGWMLSPSQGISFADIGAAAPLEAVKLVPLAGWIQIFFVMGWWECVNYDRQYNGAKRVPGDYGFDPLGFTKGKDMDSDEMKSIRLKEIKNGRVAMLTIAGWTANEAIPGAFPIWHP